MTVGSLSTMDSMFYSLTLKTVESGDYIYYVCRAENTHGKGQVAMKLYRKSNISSAVICKIQLLVRVVSFDKERLRIFCCIHIITSLKNPNIKECVQSEKFIIHIPHSTIEQPEKAVLTIIYSSKMPQVIILSLQCMSPNLS